MIRHEYITETRENMRGGDGVVTIHNFVADSEKCPNLRLLGMIELPPGASIGEHVHDGEAEIFSIVSGEGEYNDNGVAVPVKVGDVTVCYSGQVHGIRNTGSAPLVINGVIIQG